MFKRLDDHALFDRFTSYLVEELGRSPRTAESYIGAVKRAAAFADKPAHKVTADDLREILRSSGFALSTKRGIVVACRQFHLWGNVEGLWALNGMVALKTPKVPKQVLPPMSAQEARRALAHCDSPLRYRLAYLGLYAGLRVSESAQIDREAWHGGWLTVWGKGSKKRRVPVHPELEKVREIILSRSPNRRTLEVTWTRYRDRLDLKTIEGTKATTHTLRRTCASEMYRSAPWEVVAKVLGHGADVTASYAQIPDADMQAAIGSIYYMRGQPVQLVLW